MKKKKFYILAIVVIIILFLTFLCTYEEGVAGSWGMNRSINWGWNFGF